MSYKTKSFHIFVEHKPPPSFPITIMVPVYHFKDCNRLFMITTNSEHYLKSMIEYNLDKQLIIKRHEAPNLPVSPAACIDRTNAIIYIVSYGDRLFITFDIKTSKWKVIPQNKDPVSNGFLHPGNCSFIQSPVNELHFVQKHHFKYDIQQNKAIAYNNNTSWRSDTNELFWPSLLYHHAGRKLLMFQHDSDEILCCDRSDEDGNISDWREYPLSLPTNSKLGINHILAWDKILFLFDYDDDTFWKIWCLDLENNDKWYQSHQRNYQIKNVWSVYHMRL